MNHALEAILKGGLPEQQIILVHGCEGKLRWSPFESGTGMSLRCELKAYALGRANSLTTELPVPLPDDIDAITAMMRIHTSQIIHAANCQISRQI